MNERESESESERKRLNCAVSGSDLRPTLQVKRSWLETAGCRELVGILSLSLLDRSGGHNQLRILLRTKTYKTATCAQQEQIVSDPPAQVFQTVTET